MARMRPERASATGVAESIQAAATSLATTAGGICATVF